MPPLSRCGKHAPSKKSGGVAAAFQKNFPNEMTIII